MTQITRCGFNHNSIVVLLRPFNKPLVYNNLTRVKAASLLGSSTRSCPTYGRSENLRETVSLALSGQRSLLPLSGSWNQESLQVRILSSWSSCSTPVQPSNLGFAISALPACAKILRRALIVAIPKAEKSLRIQRDIARYLFCVCLSRSLRNSSTFVSKQSSTFRRGSSTVRLGHLADAGHRGQIFG